MPGSAAATDDDPLTGLDGVPWAQLQHCYMADDVPGHLRAMRAGVREGRSFRVRSSRTISCTRARALRPRCIPFRSSCGWHSTRDWPIGIDSSVCWSPSRSVCGLANRLALDASPCSRRPASLPSPHALPAGPTRADHSRTLIDLTVPEIRRLIGTLFVLRTSPHCCTGPPGAGTTRPPPAAATTSDASPPGPSVAVRSRSGCSILSLFGPVVARRTRSIACSNENSGVWTPMTTNPSFRQACDHTHVRLRAQRVMYLRVQKYKDGMATQLGAAEPLGDGPLGRPAELSLCRRSGVDITRSDRRPARVSSTSSSGCSQAAKWPPLGSLL